MVVLFLLFLAIHLPLSGMEDRQYIPEIKNTTIKLDDGTYKINVESDIDDEAIDELVTFLKEEARDPCYPSDITFEKVPLENSTVSEARMNGRILGLRKWSNYLAFHFPKTQRSVFE